MSLTRPPLSQVRTEPSGSPIPVPPLRHGDCLTREEFERRYHAQPYVQRAELIRGKVSMPSPVSLRGHASPHHRLGGWLERYEDATPGTVGSDNGTVRLDDENEFQPDLFLMVEPEYGGRVRLSNDDYVEGAPELVVEVARGSTAMDERDRLQAYEQHGVEEYVVWRTADRAVDWFVRREERFVPLEPGPDGIYRSEVFPGLWLDREALVTRTRGRVREVLEAGLASPEHAEFVKRLAARRN